MSPTWQEGDGIEIPHGVIREIGREIGKGAFGRVFIARVAEIPGKLSSQIVAIKKLKSEYEDCFFRRLVKLLLLKPLKYLR